MARYSRRKLNEFLQRSNNATTSTEKGRALEDLICYVFEKVPGMSVSFRNETNYAETEEIDIGFWNESFNSKGFYYFPSIVLVECKNWSDPVDTQNVSYFIQKLHNRGRDYGIIVATNGITGSRERNERAYYEISMALSRGLNILILTLEEIRNLDNTQDLVNLFKDKLCELAMTTITY